jgi:hypothetical protein
MYATFDTLLSVQMRTRDWGKRQRQGRHAPRVLVLLQGYHTPKMQPCVHQTPEECRC